MDQLNQLYIYLTDPSNWFSLGSLIQAFCWILLALGILIRMPDEKSTRITRRDNFGVFVSTIAGVLITFFVAVSLGASFVLALVLAAVVGVFVFRRGGVADWFTRRPESSVPPSAALLVLVLIASLALTACGVVPPGASTQAPANPPAATQAPAPAPTTTQAPSQPAVTEAPAANPAPTTSGKCEITSAKLEELKAAAVKSAADNLEAVGLMIASLDKYFESLGLQGTQCAWHEEGSKIPSGVVLWTNFHGSSNQAKVAAYMVDGDYGVFTSSGEFNVPIPNSGGRYLFVAGAAPVAVNPTGCVTQDQFDGILNAQDPGVAYDKFFEKTGYQYGKPIEKGGQVTPGLFHGFLADSTGQDNLGTNLWWINVSTYAKDGGRWMPICSGVTLPK